MDCRTRGSLLALIVSMVWLAGCVVPAVPSPTDTTAEIATETEPSPMPSPLASPIRRDAVRPGLGETSGTGFVELDSMPSGAAIFINDREMTDVTPARFELREGMYEVRMEKRSMRAAVTIKVTANETVSQKLRLSTK